MIAKIVCLLIAIKYKIKYGKKIEYNGIPNCEWNSKINIKSGKVCIGRGFHIRSGSYIAAVKNGIVSIGDDVFINRNCSIVCQDSITIGEHCAFGPNVVLYDHDHCFGRQGIVTGYKTSPITIDKNCWIGAGAIILRGTHIGEGCIIGAGSIVKGEIPPYSKVVSVKQKELTIVPIID